MNEEHFTLHLQYKHRGMFANCKHEELSYPKNVQPHSSNSIEALLERQPHYSQFNHENVTLSSGTPPLASYKEVPTHPPPPPPLGG